MSDKKKNKNKQKVSTIVGPGVKQWQEGDAPIDLGMMDEIVLSDENPNLLRFEDDPNYTDNFKYYGGTPAGFEMLAGRLNPKALWKMAKDVPKLYKQLKNIKPKDVKAAINTAKTTGKEAITKSKEFFKRFKKPDYSKAPDPLKPPNLGGTNVAPKGGQQTIQFPDYKPTPTYGPHPKPKPTTPKTPEKGWLKDKLDKTGEWATETVKPVGRKTLKGKGYSDAQIDEIQKWGMRGIVGLGAGTALISGTSGDESRSKRKEKHTYYLDEEGRKYKLVGGKQVYVDEDGGLYSRALQYMQGGVQQLPGGVMQPIGGGAVEFVGNEHDEAGMGSDSGILLDPQTEVEDGETMTQVAAQGGMKDYFFSNKLKSGGMTFADRHKQMVDQGAGQDEVNWLAKMQESVAGRNPGVIKAETGGMRRRFGNGGGDLSLPSDFELNPLQQEYFKLLETQDERYEPYGPSTGGVPEEDPMMYDDHDGDGLPNYADPEYRNLNDQGKAIANLQAAKKDAEKSNTPTKNVSPQELKKYQAYGETYDKVETALTDSGFKAGKRADDQGAEGIAGMQNQIGDSGVYGEASMDSEEGRQDFYNRNKSLLNEMGVNSWEEWNPKEMAGEFQRNFNDRLSDRWDNDEQFRTEMEGKGVTRDEYMSTGFEVDGKGASALDEKFGEYSFSRTSEIDDPAREDFDADEEDDVEIEEITVDPEGEKKPDIADEGPVKKGGPDLTSLAQFLPSMMALRDRPDYMSEADPIVADAVFASDAGKVNLDRMDYTDEKSRLQNQLNAMTYNPNKQMSTSEKAMMLTRFNQGQSKIAAEETRANTEIANREAATNVQIEQGNKQRRLAASQQNAANQLAASKANAKNKMYVDEFNRGADAATFDRKLNAVQTMATNLGTLRGDQLRYKADMNTAKANLAGTVGPDGKTIYDRKAIDELFARYGGIRKNKD